MGKTLAEKVWDEHVVRSAEGEPDLLFIDLHLIHEVTSPQAFDGLRLAGRQVRRPDLTLATEDHNVPTLDWDKPIADPVSKTQVDTLRRNAEEFGVRLHPLGDIEQGIVHVVGPQLGLTQPGMTIVCGDSHTSTHGAFGAIAFGIGTSEVEHVLATQTLMQAKPHTMVMPGWVSPSCGPTTCTMPCSMSPSGCRRSPNSAQLARSASICVRLVRSAIGLSISRVGVLWSSVAIVRSTLRSGRPSARSPSKA